MPTFKSLKEVREKLAALTLATAASEARMSVARLMGIERGDPASVAELEQLADVYGVDSDVLLEDTVQVRDGDGIALLTSMTEFQDVSDLCRARIIRAANAARDLVSLRRRLADTENTEALPCLVPPAQLDAPFEQGAWLAAHLRSRLGLGARPIPSMRDFMSQYFPSGGRAVRGSGL
ncbi:MAG: helix-turn-helix domain-containing protein [Deltaproteobacteria bacterium]|nr:helix-turn-helix domain-containing protein [Deltaproteobacteria bacterium]